MAELQQFSARIRRAACGKLPDRTLPFESSSAAGCTQESAFQFRNLWIVTQPDRHKRLCKSVSRSSALHDAIDVNLHPSCRCWDEGYPLKGIYIRRPAAQLFETFLQRWRVSGRILGESLLQALPELTC